MPSVTVRGHVPQPLETVFDYVADTRNDPEWVPLVDHVRQIQGDGPGEGAKYLVAQRLIGGKVVDMSLEVTSYTRPAEITWEGRRVLFSMAFAPAKGGTHIIQRTTVNTGSWISDVIWRLMAPRAIRRQHRALRRVLLAKVEKG